MSKPGYAQTQEQGHNILRASLLAAAGISFEKQARLLQKAMNKLEAKIDATKTEIIAHQGDYQLVEVEDNAAQLRASEALIDVLGAKPSKQTGDGQGDVIVNITFPAACQPTTPLQVVESTGTIEVQGSEVREINSLALTDSNVELS